MDLLIHDWIKRETKESILVLAGPLDNKCKYQNYLRSLTDQYADKFLWTGMLNHEDKWSMLHAVDSLILPSHQENFGMVVAEALSIGKPVYISNKVNLWREVLDGNAGFVANDDASGVSKLLDQWEQTSSFKLSENARICFQRNFDIATTAKKLIDLSQMCSSSK